MTDLSGMPGGNNTVAFEAAQVFKVNGATTDVATVVVRYRNVIVTVVLNGVDHANTGNYGPVSPGVLNSAAQTVAQQVTSQLVHWIPLESATSKVVLLLGLETATPAVTVALHDGGQPLARARHRRRAPSR